MPLSIFNQFIYFVLASVKFRALVGAQGWAPAQAGWDAQETPLGHFLFCIVAEKGRKLNRSALSFLSSQPTGQFTSADMWKSYFVLIRSQTGFLTQSWLSHTCAGQENVSFFCLVYGCCWSGSTFLPQTDGNMSLSLRTQSETPLLVLFSSCLSKHTCAGKQAVH